MSNFTKFYWGLCTLLAAITLGLFAVGSLGWFAITVIGFVGCLFIFMGMICVTPTIVGPHASEFEHADAEPRPRKAEAKTTTRNAWARSPGGYQKAHIR